MAHPTRSNRSTLSAEALCRLNSFLECVPPEELREHLLELYHQYLINEHESLPVNFGDMANNMQMLFELLKFLAQNNQPTQSGS